MPCSLSTVNFLRNHVQDFFSRLHHELVHVLDEGFDVVLANLRFEVFSGDQSAVLETLDVLAGDADVHQADLGTHLLLSLLNGLLDDATVRSMLATTPRDTPTDSLRP